MNKSEFDKVMKYMQKGNQEYKSRFTIIKEKPEVPKVKKIDKVTLAKIKYFKRKEKRENFKSSMLHNIGMMTIYEDQILV